MLMIMMRIVIMKVLVMTMVSMTIIIMTNILMTMMILTMMMVKIFCRPASYGSWQAQIAMITMTSFSMTMIFMTMINHCYNNFVQASRLWFLASTDYFHDKDFMTIIIMTITIVCRPAAYGSWQAQIASKVEGPSKEPGPFLYSGMILFDDYDEDV